VDENPITVTTTIALYTGTLLSINPRIHIHI